MVKLLNSDNIRERTTAFFEQEKSRLRDIFSTADIQEIGGTSIPDCLTKGDLDINVRVEKEEFLVAVEKLKTMYSVNQKENWSESFASFSDNERDMGVQLTIIDSQDDFFVKQRDFFRSHPGKVKEYNQIKEMAKDLIDEEYRIKKAKFLKKISKYL